MTYLRCTDCGHIFLGQWTKTVTCPLCVIEAQRKEKLESGAEFVTTAIERQMHVAYAEKIIRDHQRREQV